MSQHYHYQQAKAAREGDKFAEIAKQHGYFSKQEAQDLIASAMVDFLNELIHGSERFEVGNTAGYYEIQNRFTDFLARYNVEVLHLYSGQWATMVQVK